MSNASTLPVLTVKGLSFKINKRQILSEIHFEALRGKTLAIVGHNGAGKTTLFHILLGLKFQKTGEVLLDGKSNLDPNSRAKLGYVPERPYFNLEISFRSFLVFHSSLAGLRGLDLNKEIQRVALVVGLADYLDEALKTFSKGMLQKALLAQSMLGNPEIMILDEPMSGLDVDARLNIRNQIIAFKEEGKTLIFSSHALEDVERLADQVLILDSGKIKFYGSVSEWKASLGGAK